MIRSNPNFQELSKWIYSKKSFLLVTHKGPDGDALGSLFGLHLALSEAGFFCLSYVKDAIPERYLEFVPKEISIGTSVDGSNFDAIICLDSANEGRLDLPNSMNLRDFNLPTCNLDHHPDNPNYGQMNVVHPECSATAELLSLFLKYQGKPISSKTATALLIGLITDTGSFRFDNTTSQTFLCASWLMKHHADHRTIIRKLFFEESLNVLKLKAAIYEKMKFAFNDRLAYFSLTSDLLREFNVNENSIEDIVDLGRLIKGTEIICRLQEYAGGIRFSLRSKTPEIAVDSLAHQLGGGGHRMAAGAFVNNLNLEEGEKLLLNYVKSSFE